jgi:hypothetical protein
VHTSKKISSFWYFVKSKVASMITGNEENDQTSSTKPQIPAIPDNSNQHLQQNQLGNGNLPA